MRSFAPARFRAVVASSSSACAFFFIARIVLMGKMIQLTASDGHKFDAYRADPAGEPRGGIGVIQGSFRGDKDAHIPVDGVKKLAEKSPQHQIFIYAAAHGFNCDQRGSYNAPAAKQARERTLAFFRKHVG